MHVDEFADLDCLLADFPIDTVYGQAVTRLRPES